MKISEFQRLIEDIYFVKDSTRGPEKSFLWLAEEVGELAEVIRKRDKENMPEEFADVLAWLCTLASMMDIDVEEAAKQKYAEGCPYCHSTPCNCSEA
ncbi:MAG: MazG nucleotide pyrophosphohydrolase domain-containing protein [Planctomycetota bacterium]|jgi:NTP pyrophosphatase (non-canonical NTP hydrolase)|nr:MazG nucleotide pyrophosphohydrolase domain-containing protein [Planctomycetota bacterium]|tara:strand:+ start:111 stop:401 length:291 start_codon:yes stop_codon:yes gene_type:complete